MAKCSVSGFVSGQILCNTNAGVIGRVSADGTAFNPNWLALTNPQWVLLPLVVGTGDAVQLVDPAASAAQRFYRVRRW